MMRAASIRSPLVLSILACVAFAATIAQSGCGGAAAPVTKRVVGLWQASGSMGESTIQIEIKDGVVTALPVSGTITNMTGGTAKTFMLSGSVNFDDPKVAMRLLAVVGASTQIYNFTGALASDANTFMGTNVEMASGNGEVLTFTRR